ncbi:hypothetical protein T4B_5791 [Trichinella pseudospiralis]|uniref:Uncharacterized protein n=1 Tax=Trichinella pseudospiralis TaxID=6337 RepID=A0A0V1JLA3_TRIPS|nr:hypothetical protein T4B_5791 [Trichinella pseudospiralis]KRZ35779.1 hypothetical protein T4C_2102 [Trichinella pseudospiralis]
MTVQPYFLYRAALRSSIVRLHCFSRNILLYTQKNASQRHYSTDYLSLLRIEQEKENDRQYERMCLKDGKYYDY